MLYIDTAMLLSSPQTPHGTTVAHGTKILKFDCMPRFRIASNSKS